VASDDIPPSPLVFSKRFAISSIVYSIYSIISVREALNQEKNVKKSDIRSKLLYNCIAKSGKFVNFLNFFYQNLDYPPRRGDNVSISDIRTNFLTAKYSR
jgi:hypothetical protein